MGSVLDAFWRAAAYCLHPRVIFLSLLPLIIAAAVSLGLGYLYWEGTVAAVRGTLDSWPFVAGFLDWLDSIGAGALRAAIAPLLVLAIAVPVVVVLSLLLVATTMTPALVNLVSSRRFPLLERRHGAAWWQSVAWSIGWTLLALAVLLLSMPLWLLPPLILLLPPLIWGWLTYRVLSNDVLSDHASADERQRIIREQRWPLLAMGVLTGYLGAAPSLLWALSAPFLLFLPFVAVLAVWLYTLVFAFSALWFAHFALAALDRLRAAHGLGATDLAADASVVPRTAHEPLGPPAPAP